MTTTAADGTEFCEVCGSASFGGLCPQCDRRPARKTTLAASVERNRLASERHFARARRLDGLPRWRQAALRLFWWFTA